MNPNRGAGVVDYDLSGPDDGGTITREEYHRRRYQELAARERTTPEIRRSKHEPADR